MNKILSIYQNTGVLPPPPHEENPKEYIFGAISGIVHEDRNTTGDWRPFLVSNERQKYRYFDTFGCVSFSCLNSVELQFKWLLASNLIRKDDIEENVGDVIRKIYYCVIRYQQNKETAEKWEKILDAIKKIDPAGRPPI